VRSAQVWSYPALTLFQSVWGPTLASVVVSVVAPLPSCPFVLRPQQNSAWSVRIAQV
jgi:hypothetical protein